jgi:SIR2-like domain
MTPVDNIYVVGAGFSRNAGLPLANEFTEALLGVSHLSKDAQSTILAEFLRHFVDDLFGGGTRVKPLDWPRLEDLFTTIDLAANTGHNLGPHYSASLLRTVRRALIVRVIRLLRESFAKRRMGLANEWKILRQFLREVPAEKSAFLSMNWDSVIEVTLEKEQGIASFDYGCSAVAAQFQGERVARRRVPANARTVQVLKPHGSINWMYCDACTHVFWFRDISAQKIPLRLFKASDIERVHEVIGKRPPIAPAFPTCPDCQATALGTRFATFSYQKALDFPLHQATWRTAEQLLQNAKNWIFIGYSMPAADYQFKHLLKRVQLARPTAPRVFLVTKGSTPDPDDDPTVENYRRFFGKDSIPTDQLFLNGIDGSTLGAFRRIGLL